MATPSSIPAMRFQNIKMSGSDVNKSIMYDVEVIWRVSREEDAATAIIQGEYPRVRRYKEGTHVND